MVFNLVNPKWLAILQEELPFSGAELRIQVSTRCGKSGKGLGRNRGHAHIAGGKDESVEGLICTRPRVGYAGCDDYPNAHILHEVSHIIADGLAFRRRRDKSSRRFTQCNHGARWQKVYNDLLAAWGFIGEGTKYACDSTARLNKRGKVYKARKAQMAARD